MARTLPYSHPMTSPSLSVVPSPCVGVCHMNGATGWCEGCLRTIDEIALWSQLTDRDKIAVWKALPQRSTKLPEPDA